LRKWIGAALKLLWGGFLAVTSLYCLLAFLPYTYYALIKAPAYSWVPFFVRHHALWFWIVSFGAAFAFHSPKNKLRYFVSLALTGCVGLFLAFNPFLANLQSNRSAYWGGVFALWLLITTVFLCGLESREPETEQNTVASNFPRTTRPRSSAFHLSYVAAAGLATLIAAISTVAMHIQSYSDTREWQWHSGDFYVAFWSFVTHVAVAVVLVSVVNLVRSAASWSAKPERWRQILPSALIFAGLWVLFLRFLENALSFRGWQAQLYAASLAAALTLVGFLIAQPFLQDMTEASSTDSRGEKIVLFFVVGAFAVAALAMPTLLGGGDWNGLYEGGFTVLFWLVLGACVFRLWPRRGTYRLQTILAVLVLSAVAYKGLGMTLLVWAKPLGSTEDSIQRGFDQYAMRDASFNLTNRLLGNGRSENCGDLCRILREYTEVRNARTTTELKLVDPLTPAAGTRPNIFLFVIDSMRPDYLGAYNPQATFTPNLDAFAQDSVVIHNVFTPYAGTSLSEPAIWAGALLLHAHFLQPFKNVNSLEKLAKTDGYKMFVSYDEILSEILSPADDLVKLDTDKKLWNQLEVCSTVQQAEKVFENRTDKAQPIFFYSQPKNVHQFARNDLPTPKNANWPAQPGFNYRISFEVHEVDECLGSFFGWLKTHGLYDDSIIIVTSDHGDATGELGRNSHSVVIYPEVMRVPLLVHLPKAVRGRFVHDDNQVSALIDIAPSLYYLLGHRPIVANPLFGHPLFTETEEELQSYRRDDLFLASDVRAAYGILADNGRYFYATYDSPAQSYLYDLAQDPKGEHDVLTAALKRQYDARIIEYLHEIGDFYGYQPGIGSLLASSR
jgi:hypothetical protein